MLIKINTRNHKGACSRRFGSTIVVYCLVSVWVSVVQVPTYVLNIILMMNVLRSLKSAPLSKYAIYSSDFMQTTLFYLKRFLKKLADDQCSSMTKGTYLPYQTYVRTTFYHCNGLSKNLTFNGSIYNVFICKYCIFTWYGRNCGIYQSLMNRVCILSHRQ